MQSSSRGNCMHRLYSALCVVNFLELILLLVFLCIPDDRGSTAGYMGGEHDKTLSNYISDDEVRGLQFAAAFVALLGSVLGMYTLITIASGRCGSTVDPPPFARELLCFPALSGA